MQGDLCQGEFIEVNSRVVSYGSSDIGAEFIVLLRKETAQGREGGLG
jgi:hypothetical protein